MRLRPYQLYYTQLSIDQSINFSFFYKWENKNVVLLKTIELTHKKNKSTDIVNNINKKKGIHQSKWLLIRKNTTI